MVTNQPTNQPALDRPPHRRGVTKDPLCTLFVGRLNPDTTDGKYASCIHMMIY
jgi:hypothetical protein